MKKTIKLLTISSLLVSISAPSAFAIDQFITVKFRKPVSQEFIKEINSMTKTTLNKKIDANTYKFKIKPPATSDILDKHSELFSIMQEVQKVSPLPKIKYEDKMNNFYYMNNSVNQQQTPKSGDVTNNLDQDETKMLENEATIKFKQGTDQEEIDIINNSLGGQVSYDKNSNSYKIVLPETVDFDYAKNFYETNRYVESFQQNSETIKKEATNPDAPVTTTLNSNQGVSTTMDLSPNDVKVVFKIGKGDIGLKWLEDHFGAEIVRKKSFNSYILRFPSYMNPKKVARALKACTVVSSSEPSYE